jgi:hypothetical protein
MVMNGNACGSAAWTAADWGAGTASAADFWLLNNVDECGSAPCGPSGSCVAGTSHAAGEYTCTCTEGWEGDTCDEFDFYSACRDRAAAGTTGTFACAETQASGDDQAACESLANYGGCWWEGSPSDGGSKCRSVVGTRVVYTPWFCECLESVDATRYYGEDPSYLRSWFSDGYCDEVFNTPECRYDDESGGVSTHLSIQV